MHSNTVYWIILGLHIEEGLLFLLHSHDRLLNADREAQALAIAELKLQLSLIKHSSLAGTHNSY